MAFNKRTYPNKYFAWYNDDNRLAVVTEDTTSTTGERTTEKYDTFQGAGNLSGNITATSTSSTVVLTSASHGLATGDRVTISGTTTYDGNKTITYVDDNSFSITDSNSSSNEGASSGVTWTSLFVDKGLRITYHSKYEEVTAIGNDLYSNSGLDSGLHNALLCYVKSRMYEDMGNIQQAQYFYQMYDNKVKKFKSRRSGLRFLSVPKI